LERVVAEVLARAEVRPGDVAVDLGAGTGSVALGLVRLGASVLALDVSPEMVRRLGARAASEGAQGLEVSCLPIEELRLAPGSVDVVATNYALHHLRDPDKERLVESVFTWLRPGGRLVIGDLMLGRGFGPRDRRIVRDKAVTFLRRGPGGWWRLAKNVVRFTLRVQERPLSMERWCELLRSAGFSDVEGVEVVAEASVVVGRRSLEG
jgi:SAM-dependent methyltransferase